MALQEKRPSQFAQCATCPKASDAVANAMTRVEQNEDFLSIDITCDPIPGRQRLVNIDVFMQTQAGEEGKIPWGRHREEALCPGRIDRALQGRTDMSDMLRPPPPTPSGS